MKPYIILILLIGLGYANSLENSFVDDDHTLIVENLKIDIPASKIPSILAASLGGSISYYRPIVSLLYILNYKIWGLNPIGFHMTNIIFHLISLMVLYRIGRLLFNNDKLISLVGASIFAVHPANNEPIGRAASGEVIFGVFIIITIYLFLKEKNYLSYLTFFLALLSKETAIMLPFALVILSIHNKGFKKGIIAIIPYIFLIGIYLILRTMTVDIVFGGKILQPVFTRLLTMAAALSDYIRLLLIPYPLSPHYHARWYVSVFEPKVIIATAVLTLVSFLAFRIRKDKIMFFLLIFPFIMLAPVIVRVNALPIAIKDSMFISERYLYVPLTMFSFFISAYFVKLFKNRAQWQFMTGWILVIVIFTVITASATTTWKNDITLFQKIIKVSPENALAHNGLGFGYYKEGQMDDAIKEYMTALRLNPKNVNAYNNLGLAYAKQGRLDEAIKQYLILLTIKPDFIPAYNNLGNAHIAQGRFDEAINVCLIALRFNPNNIHIHYNLGRAYFEKRLKDKARNEFEIVLKRKPDFTQAQEALKLLNTGFQDR